MKKFTTIIVFCTSIISYSQSTELSSSQSTELSPVKQHIIPAQEEELKVLKLSLDSLKTEYKILKGTSETNRKQVSMILSGRELEAQAKYDIVKTNIINARETFYLLNKKIIDLKSRNSTEEFNSLIKDLNNPESKALGFSFNEKIIELVKTHINPRKRNIGERIVSTIESITQSPIVTNLNQLTPALSVANSALNVIRSTGIVRDDIDQEKIEAFEKELEGYISYYVALNEANQSLNYSIKNQHSELDLIHQKLYEQLLFFANNLNQTYQPKANSEDLNTYMTEFLRDFDEKAVRSYFETLEMQNMAQDKINYEKILTENYALKEANNRLEEVISLVNQYEFKYNDHFNSLQIYYTSIESALDITIKNGIANRTTVENKKGEFSTKKDTSMKLIKDAIDIQELLNNKKTVNYSAKII